MDKTSFEKKEFLHYELTADTLCLGERERAGSFRPCIDVFPCTALAGALKARFPRPDRRIFAAGKFINSNPSFNKREILIFSPRDRLKEVSSVPLHIEFLSNVKADVFVFKNDETAKYPEKFTMSLGAMTSKGFGFCRLALKGCIPKKEPVEGELICRLPEEKDYFNIFSVEVLDPVYGYLFKPITGGKGYYSRALFEGSTVKADPIILNLVIQREVITEMDDPIERVIATIIKLEEVQRTRFSGKFLNNVAEIFEDHGFGTSRLFLTEKKSRPDRHLATQASALLVVLDCMEGCESIKQNRAIGHLIIKTLESLKKLHKVNQGR